MNSGIISLAKGLVITKIQKHHVSPCLSFGCSKAFLGDGHFKRLFKAKSTKKCLKFDENRDKFSIL